MNAKDDLSKTGFDWACGLGNLKLVEMIIQKSTDVEIELNNKDNIGYTAFHGACENGHSKIAEILMHNNDKLRLDLNDKCKSGSTAFHLACIRRYSNKDQGHTETGKSILFNPMLHRVMPL